MPVHRQAVLAHYAAGDSLTSNFQAELDAASDGWLSEVDNQIILKALIRMNKKMQPLVSIIVPCYNHERYVQECIKSIIDQDYENIELIVIDDGSQDSSVDKIKEIVPVCKNRFRRFEFISRSNKGLCATLNEAIVWIEGQYFSTIASDDILINTKISKLIIYMLNNLEVSAVFGGMNVVNKNNKIIYVEVQNIEHTFDDLLIHRNIPSAPASLLRADVVREIGGYPESINIEDWYMWLMMTSRGFRLQSIPQVVVNYRMHEENSSSNLKAMHEGRLKVAKYFKNVECYPRALKYLKYIGLRSIAKEDIWYAIKNAFPDRDLDIYQKIVIFLVGLTPKYISMFICYLIKKFQIRTYYNY